MFFNVNDSHQHNGEMNMTNVFKDVLTEIYTNGLKEGHHLYVTFETSKKNVRIPDWLKKKISNRNNHCNSI